MPLIKKTFILSALIVLTSSIFIAKSSIVFDKKIRPKFAEKTKRSYFQFPHVLITIYENKNKSFQKIEVLFKTNKTGKVNFISVNTENKSIKKEIEKQFYELKLPKIKSNYLHNVVLEFSIL